MTRSLPSLRWTPVLLAWSALALAFLPQAVVLNLSRPEPLPLWVAITRNALIFGLWALFTPAALAAVRRWPPLGEARWRNGLRLLGVALLLSALHVVLMTLATAAIFGGQVDLLRLFGGMAVGLAATNLLMAAALLAIGIALLQWEARRRAEQQLTEARLAALRHQLQPHFLFNTLNALAELVHQDPARAEALLLQLSGLLRRALDGGAMQRVSLREELDFLDDYLAIQQTLLGDRLRIERDLPADTLDLALPPMLLQPLVENALRHGLGGRREGGVLQLRSRRESAALSIEIGDDGPGAAFPLRESVGLANTRERLANEYAGRATLALETAPGAGFRVRLELPLEHA